MMNEEIKTRKLHFSIDGQFITKLAKEWLFTEHKPYELVEELLLSCMQGTNEPLAKLKTYVQDILMGRAELKGVSDGEEGLSLVYLEDDLNDDNIFTRYNKIVQKYENTKKESNIISKKYCDLIDCLENWNEEFLDVSLIGDKYVKQILLDIERKYTVCTKYKNEKKETINTGNSLVDSYIKAVKYDIKYGWLDPSGNFYEVEWGEHQIWPYYSILYNANIYDTFKEKGKEYNAIDLSRYYNDYVKYLEKFNGDPISEGADFLVNEKNWILVHSPSNGVPVITSNDSNRMTKAQKEFLFDYYMNIDEPKKASELYKEEEI